MISARQNSINENKGHLPVTEYPENRIGCSVNIHFLTSQPIAETSRPRKDEVRLQTKAYNFRMKRS